MDKEAENMDVTLYLTFLLESEVLALEVTRVREVLDICQITRVPNAPDYLLGVVNLRGSVIPVIDLRMKFGLPQTESTIDARIVILELSRDGVEAVAGIMADSVHDVIGIGRDQISPPPESGAHWRREYIKGIGKYGEDFILLLDIHRVFIEQERMPVSTGDM